MLNNFPIVGKPYRPIKIKSFNAYKGLQFGGGGELPIVQPKILRDFEKFRTSPEGKDYFRMMEENRIAKKNSGRVDYAEIDPITDVILPLGAAKFAGLLRSTPKPITGSKSLYSAIRKEAERPLRDNEIEMLRNELSKNGILDIQKTTNFPGKSNIKEAVRNSITPYGYDVHESEITGNRIKDVFGYIANRKNPGYSQQMEDEFVGFLGEGHFSPRNNFTTDDLIADYRAKTPEIHKTIRGAANAEADIRYNPRLQPQTRLNRATSWDMYLGNSQEKNPMYNISSRSTNKNVIYTPNESFQNTDELEKSFKIMHNSIDGYDNKGFVSDADFLREYGHRPKQINNPAEKFIKEGYDTAITGRDVDHYGTMGGHTWNTKMLDNGNREFSTIDRWDLHPLAESELKQSSAPWYISPFKNLEVGKFTGLGKPFDVHAGYEWNPATGKIVKKLKYGGKLKLTNL